MLTSADHLRFQPLYVGENGVLSQTLMGQGAGAAGENVMEPKVPCP